MSIKIFFSEDGKKAKGVWMSEEKNEVPQIVGLSKWQFFGFLIAVMFMGAGAFGVGYTLAYFKSEKVKKSKQQQKNQSLDNYANQQQQNPNNTINDTATYTPDQMSSNVSDIYKNQTFYITMGMYRNEEDAKNLINELAKLGKKGNLKQHGIIFLVYLGPYESKSLAQNELDSIELSTSLNGSLQRNLP